MTLYDETGLSRQATAEEIRQAYHNFVRLLHPDTVRDPALQALAEGQLRHINAIFEVLNDPKRRAGYDLTLDHGPDRGLAVTAPGPPSIAPGSLPSFWGIALITLLTVLFWAAGKQATPVAAKGGGDPALAAGRVPAVAERAVPRTAASVMTREMARELRQLRRELQVVREEQPLVGDDGLPRGKSTESAETLSDGDPDVGSPVRSNLAPMPAPARVTPLTQPPASRPVPGQTSVVGTWLYAQRAVEATKQDWYPPDYIELKIQPSANGLSGRYQARYRVGDKPISPEVRFRFEGKGEAFAWAGANGARGEIHLTQTSPLTLQVDWVTTQAGGLPALTSGSSVLVKSPE